MASHLTHFVISPSNKERNKHTQANKKVKQSHQLHLTMYTIFHIYKFSNFPINVGKYDCSFLFLNQYWSGQLHIIQFHFIFTLLYIPTHSKSPRKVK